MNRKIYEITIPKGKQPLFYNRNGYLTHVNDDKYPLNFGSSLEWSPEEGYKRITNEFTNTLRYIFPTARVHKKNFGAYIKTCLNDFNNNSTYNDVEGNYIVIKTYIGSDNYLDVGVSILDAITEKEVG